MMGEDGSTQALDGPLKIKTVSLLHSSNTLSYPQSHVVESRLYSHVLEAEHIQLLDDGIHCPSLLGAIVQQGERNDASLISMPGSGIQNGKRQPGDNAMPDFSSLLILWQGMAVLPGPGTGHSVTPHSQAFTCLAGCK